MKKTLVSCMVLLCACGSSTSGNHNQNPNCQPGTGTTLNASCDPGFTQTAPNRPGTIQVTFSGETFGVDGLPFPGNAGDPVFVDGWEVVFDEVLVTLDNIIAQNPGQAELMIGPLAYVLGARIRVARELERVAQRMRRRLALDDGSEVEDREPGHGPPVYFTRRAPSAARGQSPETRRAAPAAPSPRR